MGLSINLKKFISFSLRDNIQKNKNKEIIRDANPKTVWEKFILRSIKLAILLEQFKNNHSDKPVWFNIGKFKFNFWITWNSR